MKRLRLILLVPLLAAALLLALKVPVEGSEDSLRVGTEKPSYRLEFLIRGSAISRLLFFFPLRIYYEASASVDLAAVPQGNGSTCFVYSRVPRTAYILRTLGFSGKTLALLTVGGEKDGTGSFADGILAQWRSQAPEFDERVKTIKKFPHRLLAPWPQPFSFERDASGFYRDPATELEPRYHYHPSKTGIYFNVFPILADLLRLLNHRFLPPGAEKGGHAALPPEWEGDMLDFSADMNRVAGLLERAVKSLVTVKQKAPFRLHFRVASCNAEAIEICGESYPGVPLWKGFMMREVFRRVRLRAADRGLLSDEIWMSIRNAKGQGGFGCLLLKQIDSGEDNR